MDGSLPIASRRAIVASDPLVCSVLRNALQGSELAVVGEAYSFGHTLELVLRLQPDLLLVDKVLVGGDVIELIDRLKPILGTSLSVVVITSHDDDELQLKALLAGATGWLRKDMDLDQLPRALVATLDGEAAVSRRFAGVLVEAVRGSSEIGVGTRPVSSPLTARQWEVLDLLCLHQDDAQIAGHLGVTVETVRTHVRDIQRRLGVHSRDDAVDAAPGMRRG
jgi:DNA-binding NarL/FixJ family response regulator